MCERKRGEEKKELIQSLHTLMFTMSLHTSGPVCPDWAIFWTLGSFSKPNLPKSPTFLGNFCKGVKMFYFCCDIILGNIYRLLAIFFWSHCSGPPPSVSPYIERRYRSYHDCFVDNFHAHAVDGRLKAKGQNILPKCVQFLL